MTKKSFLRDFPEGDDNSYSWSTRIDKGANQFLLDIMSEEQYHSKSQTLKNIIHFAGTYWGKAKAFAGEGITARLEAKLKFAEAKREANDRQELIQELNRRLVEINQSDHPPTRRKLISTGKALAKAYGLNWPPQELPLVAYDTDASYVLNRIMSLLEQAEVNRVSLRDLVMRSIGDKDKILPVVERLEQAGYITTRTERRSGPATIWIEIPSLKVREDVETK